MKYLNKNKKGFTLVELLVVISIISFLATLAISSFTNARIKARDATRKSDLNQIRKAFLMYANDLGGVAPDPYEIQSKGGATYQSKEDGTPCLSIRPDLDSLLIDYIDVPHDPTRDCNLGYRYDYINDSCGILAALLEDSNAADLDSCKNFCGTTNNWSSIFNYCLEIRP